MSCAFTTLIVAGPDAAVFLQGQLTADIEHLEFLDQVQTEVPMGLAGLCTHQGRVIAVLWVIRRDTQLFHLLLPDVLADKVHAILKRYVFRAQVTLTMESARQEDLALVPGSSYIPWIMAENSEKYIPQMISLDILKGVHPRKGCYVGQEVITRMRDLGKNKKRLALIGLDSSQDVEINTNIRNDKHENIGTVLLVMENKALAVISLNALASSIFIQNPIEILHVWKDNDE